jgi:hypothetical protein
MTREAVHVALEHYVRGRDYSTVLSEVSSMQW